MRNIRTAFIAMAAIGTAALTASAANAQSAMRHYGPPQAGSYYGYGADRANPGRSPERLGRGQPARPAASGDALDTLT